MTFTRAVGEISGKHSPLRDSDVAPSSSTPLPSSASSSPSYDSIRIVDDGIAICSSATSTSEPLRGVRSRFSDASPIVTIYQLRIAVPSSVADRTGRLAVLITATSNIGRQFPLVHAHVFVQTLVTGTLHANGQTCGNFNRSPFLFINQRHVISVDITNYFYFFEF